MAASRIKLDDCSTDILKIEHMLNISEILNILIQ